MPKYAHTCPICGHHHAGEIYVRVGGAILAPGTRIEQKQVQVSPGKAIFEAPGPEWNLVEWSQEGWVRNETWAAPPEEDYSV